MSITTTHDPHGGGRPRLMFAMGGKTYTKDPQREFYLRPGITTIGSAEGCDLRLVGIGARHAEIRRDDDDEYTYVDLGTRTGSTVHGRSVGEYVLRTGALIVFGHWTVSYYREEFADHGKPYGGRTGEDRGERGQSVPRRRGTTPTGGSAPFGADPGEYF